VIWRSETTAKWISVWAVTPAVGSSRPWVIIIGLVIKKVELGQTLLRSHRFHFPLKIPQQLSARLSSEAVEVTPFDVRVSSDTVSYIFLRMEK
jgi:hypothetical protein